MQQSSATLKNQDVGIGLRKIVASSQCLLVSTVLSVMCVLSDYLLGQILLHELEGWGPEANFTPRDPQINICKPAGGTCMTCLKGTCSRISFGRAHVRVWERD